MNNSAYPRQPCTAAQKSKKKEKDALAAQQLSVYLQQTPKQDVWNPLAIARER
jgi:hypothetical protein